ncbi:ABC transporter permease [Actinoplanes xinjiangensis]|uniref:Putative ABC transport system permease protein n=1 Tax=Actinoplanes xinjiangensis TaxID=512350 RepID=A0A316FLB2_9ACTN|nr:FtsX-like permease family protein [Actinoplanes xinjiangensis]PWK48935.1 putative ABC transport system permease protein [Actinoplanes xinjiangensis]GIF38641.1 hypothetical protein Axi01nite_29520 [Actinoplanes xinjiangensis]
MKVISLALIAWQGIRRRPLRNLLSALSLTVGVLALVLVLSGGAVVRETIVFDSRLQGGDALTANLTLTDSPQKFAVAEYWRSSLGRALAPQRGIASVTASNDGALLRKGDETVSDLVVVTTEKALLEIRPFPVLRGTWLTDEPTYAPTVVLNHRADQMVEGQTGPVTLVAGGQTFRTSVIGVVYDAEPRPVAYLDMHADGPWQAAIEDTNVYSVQFTAPAWSIGDARSRINELASISDRAADVTGVERTDRLETFDRQLDLVNRVFLAVAILSLLIGALGILNIGLSTVRERSDELSLRRSFGATRPQVVVIMLLESQFVALVSGLAGIALVAGGLPLITAHFADRFQEVSTGFPVGGALLGLAAGSVAALVGSLAPALRASRVPIAAIMR